VAVPVFQAPAAPVAAAEPATPPPAPSKPVAPPECLAVTLTAIAEGWPDAVRKEIVETNLADARVALPVPAAEQGLKQGRIAFSWKTIRSWIKPAVSGAGSANEGTVLELPLRVVAPLFLARQKEGAKAQQKLTIDEDIPNLFFGFPQPEGPVPVAQATARPTDTNYYVWEDTHDAVKIDETETKRGPSPGTKFVAKYATPNEVVSRAAGLEGVNGAVIALPDGLMVANRLPPDVNADTLAAFLPQIFGKVSQCTRELRMGDLNNLNFTVGNIPWKIFRINSIFFAAFGRAGEPLPTAPLAALAAELDHNPK
jgi:predicted regulator of Ras-like GTPase activity (Roadblock/LC7/MglB family)